MDKTRSREKEKVETDVKPNTSERLELPVTPERLNELNDMLKMIDESHTRATKAIAKDARSFFGNKRMLFYILPLEETSHEMAKWTMISTYAVSNVDKRVANLEKIVAEITPRLDIDLKNVKAEIESLKTTLDSPMIANVSEFLKKLKEAEERSKKATEKYVQ